MFPKWNFQVIFQRKQLSLQDFEKEHVLIVLDNSKLEEKLSQPLKTNRKQFEIAVTFVTGYYGVLTVTSKNEKLFFATSIKMVASKKQGLLVLKFRTKKLKGKVTEEDNVTGEE